LGCSSEFRGLTGPDAKAVGGGLDWRSCLFELFGLVLVAASTGAPADWLNFRDLALPEAVPSQN